MHHDDNAYNDKFNVVLSVKLVLQNSFFPSFEIKHLLLRLPVLRGGIINSPRSIFCFLFFSVSKVGPPLMGDTAGTKLREPIEAVSPLCFHLKSYSSIMHIDIMCLQQNATQMLRGNTVPSPWGNLPSINVLVPAQNRLPNALAEEVEGGLNNFKFRKTI